MPSLIDHQSLWLNLTAIEVKNVQLFSSGDCSAAPHDLQCTLCQTVGIKHASCSSPAAFRCREKSFHFLSVSVWVCGAEGPAVDRLSWLSNLTFNSISHTFLWDDCFAVTHDKVTYCSCCSWNCYYLIFMREKIKWHLIPFSSVLSFCHTSPKSCLT